MIKGVVDRVRGTPGYAGMAVYHESVCVFADLLDARLADGLYHLFKDDPTAPRSVTAIVRGYSVMAFSVGEMTVVARLAGRYAAPIKIDPEDDDIALAEPVPCLMTREEARREAQELLKSFNLINHD